MLIPGNAAWIYVLQACSPASGPIEKWLDGGSVNFISGLIHGWVHTKWVLGRVGALEEVGLCGRFLERYLVQTPSFSSLYAGCRQASGSVPPQASHPDALPHHAWPRRNRTKWAWTETLERVSQNKSSWSCFSQVLRVTKVWLSTMIWSVYIVHMYENGNTVFSSINDEV
jgi:hypothetical protein